MPSFTLKAFVSEHSLVETAFLNSRGAGSLTRASTVDRGYFPTKDTFASEEE